MEKNLGNISAIPDMRQLHGGFNATSNFEDTLQDDLFKDFQFIGGLETSQRELRDDEPPSFMFLKDDLQLLASPRRENMLPPFGALLSTSKIGGEVDTATVEELKVMKIESNLEDLNQNLERVNQEINNLKKLLLE